MVHTSSKLLMQSLEVLRETQDTMLGMQAFGIAPHICIFKHMNQANSVPR